MKKPLFTREGSYGREGSIYQALQPLPEFSGRYPVIGSWIVNGQAARIGLREDDSPISLSAGASDV